MSTDTKRIVAAIAAMLVGFLMVVVTLMNAPAAKAPVIGRPVPATTSSYQTTVTLIPAYR
jgi:hypothetical protein